MKQALIWLDLNKRKHLFIDKIGYINLNYQSDCATILTGVFLFNGKYKKDRAALAILLCIIYCAHTI